MNDYKQICSPTFHDVFYRGYPALGELCDVNNSAIWTRRTTTLTASCKAATGVHSPARRAPGRLDG
jgi:hypothetical protein